MAIDLIGQFLEAQLSIHDLRGILRCPGDPGAMQIALRIGDPVHVYLSGDIEAQSFDDACTRAYQYLDEIQRNYVGKNGWIDNRDVQKVRDHIPRPTPSRPIYLITAETETTKKIVYVGRTAAKTGRFECGHAAITKLHEPRFDGMQKYVYMCSVLVRVEEDAFIPIEFLNNPRSQDYNHKILAAVEAQMIVQINPYLNADVTKDPNAPSVIIMHDNNHGLEGLNGVLFGADGTHHIDFVEVQPDV